MDEITRLINEAVELIEELSKDQIATEWERVGGHPEKYWEPAISSDARQFCHDILDAANVEDLSGCPLCQD